MSSKHVWIKKATGLGVSEFMLRFMAWLCLKDNTLAGSQMCIVTGPRIELAIALIDRMKDLLMRNNLAIFATKETVTGLFIFKYITISLASEYLYLVILCRDNYCYRHIQGQT
jgi:hypothetical protein